VVNRYPEAISVKFGRDVDDVPWGARVRDAGTMERITVAAVTAMLDRLIAGDVSAQPPLPG
jgi:hypothetical protein